MPRHLALLRSVNLGRRTVKKADLIPAFEALGFEDVWTFLASGNVVFSAESPDRDAIAAHLGRAFSFEVPVFLRGEAALLELVDDDPFGGAGTRYVAFAHAPLDPTLADRCAAVAAPHEAFVVRGRELHWQIGGDGRFSGSELSGPKLERLAGVPLTVRKDTTLARIAARLR